MATGSEDRLLYDHLDERDACGVGFVADIGGRASHAVIETALEALSNLEHRGAVGADGKTGDGAGLLTQLPLHFFNAEVERLGHQPPPAGDLAVAMAFLPRNENEADRCRRIVEKAGRDNGATVLGWRRVPVDESVLGAKALASAPRIEQLLIGRGRASPAEFEMTLRLIARDLEVRCPGCYIASLSNRTIVYKGMFVASQLDAFYSDLRDPNFETSLAIFHQRYSTNTFPNWSLAQPFRWLAHNGEINTIGGNRNWMRARTTASGSTDIAVWNEGSDSATLDRALGFLVTTGRGLMQSVMTLIPEAYENAVEISPEVRAFYEYAACEMEPWDGPAALAFSDGTVVGAALDRNGLRPARYIVTIEGLVILASEAGAVPIEPELVREKGRLGPGEMIAVDTEAHTLLRNPDIKNRVANRRPYADWVRSSIIVAPRRPFGLCELNITDEMDLIRRMKTFGYTAEDVQRILDPMLSEGKEPIGSMGDDTPLAVLSSKPRLLYSYFKQRFAQVTNPAMDPIRERLVMSLQTLVGARRELGKQEFDHSNFVRLSSPILSDADLDWLRQSCLRCVTVSAVFEAAADEEGFRRALAGLCERAGSGVGDGAEILIVSDLDTDEARAPIPMALAIGAIHNHLIRSGKRMGLSMVAQTGEARDDHQVACLIGCGANAVNPTLAFEVIAHEAIKRGHSIETAMNNYREALEDGLLKIMAKMGIATVASYCGALTFEILGLDAQLVEEHLTGAASRIGGIGLAEIAGDVGRFHRAAHASSGLPLEDSGYFRYRNGGEFHSFNPAVFRALHRAARNHNHYDRYAREVVSRPPAVLRDLIDFRGGQSVAIEQVEPVDAIVTRFSTSGMSLGALSKQAHQALAVAMNRIGAKSNSGEGGEDPFRFGPRANGDSSNSKIKQVASARFGVTPEYLVSAEELEIKIAQGSKPGEGGQLPGHKVTAEIAALRHSVPGVTLISPPPHHDIYSIEDLAQLIYDLRQINPDARIAVKLVSEAGIGTIAAGVAKARADVIHISGHDGGTGASPLGSIKNAGSPWELGLAEAQQALVLNDLRGRVRLRVDGGLKTARDVIIAAMLGAEEFGFATAAIVALGCVMARQCHLNTCPVGIATQEPRLRRKFTGSPENVITFFRGLADEVRQLLAGLGVRTLDEIIGRSELLFEKDETRLPRKGKLSLAAVIRPVDGRESKPRRFAAGRHREDAGLLGLACEHTCSEAIATGRPVAAEFEILNTDRTVGARIAGAIARRYGDAGLPDGTIDLTFRGSAGQSFGAFNIAGMRLTLVGEANDYVGKGMSGGEIIIRPPRAAKFDWAQGVILGNTVMYGATGGSLFAAGRGGERFCVRNSGGLAVVEGLGDHGCEYMTAGLVLVLGEVGRNFAAGMTGGEAYVFDDGGTFERRCNRELVHLRQPDELERERIRLLIERHHRMTLSARAYELLSNWESASGLFQKVVTQGRGVRNIKPVDTYAAPALNAVAQGELTEVAGRAD
ncbi:MAG TPA: glutamate synthase large subunit [Blastocatellia bacterium]|nr:glutamate synthase large subunit [Blastocatellia bacterium]